MFVPQLKSEESLRCKALSIVIGNGLILSGNESFPWEEETEIEEGKAFFLIGEYNQNPVYLVMVEPSDVDDGDGVREWLKILEGEPATILARTVILEKWLRENRFCGNCGKKNSFSNQDGALKCVECGTLRFPAIAPAVITLVYKGDKMLLGHNVNFPDGLFSLFAGFNEAGESLEETVRREVREEAGIEIDNIRYFGSQSWPMPNSLMVGFFAEYAGGEVCPDGEEISDISWFSKDDLPELPGFKSIARQMIHQFIGEFDSF